MLPTSRERIKLRSGTEREVFRVIPSVQRLTDTKGEDRLKSATVFVAADGTQEPLRLESKVFIGKVVAELAGFKPTPNPPTTEVKSLKIKTQF